MRVKVDYGGTHKDAQFVLAEISGFFPALKNKIRVFSVFGDWTKIRPERRQRHTRKVFERFSRKLFTKSFLEAGLGGRPTYLEACSLAAVRVFLRSIVMVIGPTPPGTGVI